MSAVSPVSVIIVARDRGALLRHTLAGLCPQMSGDDQLILVDDASTENLRRIVVEAWPTAEYLRVENHEGYRLATRINQGLVRARCEMIWRLDADCIPLAGTLAYARRRFAPNRLLAGYIRYLDEAGRVQDEDHSWRLDLLRRLAEESPAEHSVWLKTRQAFRPGLFFGGHAFFPRRLAASIGDFDSDFDGGWGAEDSWFAEKAMWEKGAELFLLPEAAVRHQWHVQVGAHRQVGQTSRNLRIWASKSGALRRPTSIPPSEDAHGGARVNHWPPVLLLRGGCKAPRAQQLAEAVLRDAIPGSTLTCAVAEGPSSRTCRDFVVAGCQVAFYCGNEVFEDAEILKAWAHALSPHPVVCVGSAVAEAGSPHPPIAKGLPVLYIPRDAATGRCLRADSAPFRASGSPILLNALRVGRASPHGGAAAVGVGSQLDPQQLSLLAEFVRRCTTRVRVFVETKAEIACAQRLLQMVGESTSATITRLGPVSDLATWRLAWQDVDWVVSVHVHHVLWAASSGHGACLFSTRDLASATLHTGLLRELGIPVRAGGRILRAPLPPTPVPQQVVTARARLLLDGLWGLTVGECEQHR